MTSDALVAAEIAGIIWSVQRYVDNARTPPPWTIPAAIGQMVPSGSPELGQLRRQHPLLMLLLQLKLDYSISY